MVAKEFYYALAADTKASKLNFDGLFVEENSNRISILFDYHWTLKSDEIIKFKVVDVIELTSDNKIEKLTIIYDTVNVRMLCSMTKISYVWMLPFTLTLCNIG